MDIVTTHGALLGIAAICAAIGMARASFYRWLKPFHGPWMLRASPRALSEVERDQVLGELHTDRFVDLAPAEVFSTLLDEGRYLCSERTMYRILADNAEVRERRDQLRHPAYAAPELLAERPNELWSWDITKLHGPRAWSYFHLYVILDVFSRYVVGWMVAERESATLAEQLLRETCERHGIEPGQLTIHADRGSSMRSKLVALLLSDLGVTKTHSRPHVSNDNPYSESHFKTLKYRPDFPERFGSVEDARAHCVPFFYWYNPVHHHGGIALVTPEDMHFGRAEALVAARSAVLSIAHGAHPERFVNGVPVAASLPTSVWINKPVAASAVVMANPDALRDSNQAKATLDGESYVSTRVAHVQSHNPIPTDNPAVDAGVADRYADKQPEPKPAKAKRAVADKRTDKLEGTRRTRASRESASTSAASAATAPAADADATEMADLRTRTQGDLIPLHPQGVSPPPDSQRITPRRNLVADPESEAERR